MHACKGACMWPPTDQLIRVADPLCNGLIQGVHTEAFQMRDTTVVHTAGVLNGTTVQHNGYTSEIRAPTGSHGQ
jgi:hypothetical protein